MDVKARREEMKVRELALATIYCWLSFLSSFYEWMARDPELGRHIQNLSPFTGGVFPKSPTGR
jgi:hypothetical protein